MKRLFALLVLLVSVAHAQTPATSTFGLDFKANNSMVCTATHYCIRANSGTAIFEQNLGAGWVPLAGASSTTLAQAYANGAAGPQVLALDSTRLGVIARDNASPIGQTLFGVQNSAGTQRYLNVLALSTASRGNLTVDGPNTVGIAQLVVANSVDSAGAFVDFRDPTAADGSRNWTLGNAAGYFQAAAWNDAIGSSLIGFQVNPTGSVFAIGGQTITTLQSPSLPFIIAAPNATPGVNQSAGSLSLRPGQATGSALGIGVNFYGSVPGASGSATQTFRQVAQVFVDAAGLVNWSFGTGDSNAPVGPGLIRGSDNTGGNNAVGLGLTIRTGLSTGNALSPDMIFRYSVPGSSGTTQQSAADAMRISGSTGLVSLFQALDLGSTQIHNVADPSSGQDAATRAWVLANTANTVSNVDGTLTCSPTSGAVVCSLALAHSNTWTALQTVQLNAIGTTRTPGLKLLNTTAATGGQDQVSPNIEWQTQMWISGVNTQENAQAYLKQIASVAQWALYSNNSLLWSIELATSKAHFQADVDLGNHLINNVGSPSAGTDAANRTYVDNSFGNWRFSANDADRSASGALTIGAGGNATSLTVTPAVGVLATSNQLLLGAAAHLVTISSTAPAGAGQTLTIPDTAGAATFSFVNFAETFSAVKTFSASPTWSSDNTLNFGDATHRAATLFTEIISSGAAAMSVTSTGGLITVKSGVASTGSAIFNKSDNANAAAAGDYLYEFQSNAAGTSGVKHFASGDTFVVATGAGFADVSGNSEVVMTSTSQISFFTSGTQRAQWTTTELQPNTDTAIALGDSTHRYGTAWGIRHLGAESAIANSATPSITLANGEVFLCNLGATSETLGGAAGFPGEIITVEVRQDATGGRSFTFSNGTNGFRIAGGAYTVSAGANAKDVFTFRWNNTDSKWDETGRALNIS